MDLATSFGLLALVMVLAALAAGVVERAPLSFPMLFLGLGLLLGANGLGVLELDPHDEVLEVVGTLTLALVLFLDAVNLEYGTSRRDLLVPALALGPGTLAIAAIVAGAAVWLLDFPVVLALALGAILASTDPVVLRDVLRDRRVPSPVRRALAVEAGTNDVVVLPILLVLIAVSNVEVGSVSGWIIFGLKILVLGPAVGFALGASGSWLMAKADARFSVRREYQSLFGVGLALGAWAAGEAVGGDGFLAAFAAGAAVTVLNQTLCDCFLEFGEAASEMAMLLAFVLFGAVLSGLLPEVALGPTLLLAVLAIFLARPAVMWTLLAIERTRLSPGARAFIAWFGPRGLNSLLFGLLVVNAGVRDAELLFATAGVVVLVSVIVHGVSATPLTSWYARRLAADTMEEERASTATEAFRHPSPDDVPRITPSQLRELLDRPDPPIVVDVRTRSQYETDREGIPGGVRVLPDQIVDWATDTSPDRLVALYCT